jgi:hypothetical protein
MELELGRKEDETKQMASLSEDLKKDLELTKQALQQSEREHSARMPAFEELKEK